MRTIYLIATSGTIEKVYSEQAGGNVDILDPHDYNRWLEPGVRSNLQLIYCDHTIPS